MRLTGSWGRRSLIVGFGRRGGGLGGRMVGVIEVKAKAKEGVYMLSFRFVLYDYG
jgi:hypothetical protein